ncbi:hypothetical protein [Pseudoclavibacter helvolus]|uniref:hypothetical protein n=1 Tax=Pseudoclavibacter helvolus TaxID=255205 RepID=UPI0008384D40|nr:hypothetical protein [Pseudoclavibacter helvolus]
METGKYLRDEFSRALRWDDPDHDVWRRIQGSLAFATRGQEVRAAAVAYDSDLAHFIVLTDSLLLRTSYSFSQSNQKPSVRILPLRELKGVEVSTDLSLFIDNVGGQWPRGVELTADFGTETVDLSPYIQSAGERAELGTTIYMTLRAALS